MPNNVVYWYGYAPSNYSTINPTTDGSITNNTRDITIARNGNTNAETGIYYSARSMASFSSFKAIVDYYTGTGAGLTRNMISGVGTSGGTYMTYTAQITKSASYNGLITVDISAVSASLSPAVTIANGGTGASNNVKISAIWLE